MSQVSNIKDILFNIDIKFICNYDMASVTV